MFTLVIVPFMQLLMVLNPPQYQAFIAAGYATEVCMEGIGTAQPQQVAMANCTGTSPSKGTHVPHR